MRRVVETAGVEPHQRKVTPRALNPLFYMLFLALGLILSVRHFSQFVVKCVPICTRALILHLHSIFRDAHEHLHIPD